MEYDLKWDGYQAWTSKCISNLVQDSNFADVTLVSDEFEYFKAHRVILSSSSEFFQKVLNEPDILKNSSNLLFLRGISSSILKNILMFIYEGKVSLQEGDLHKFLEIGFELKVTGVLSGKESVMRKKTKTYDDSEVSSDIALLEEHNVSNEMEDVISETKENVKEDFRDAIALLAENNKRNNGEHSKGNSNSIEESEIFIDVMKDVDKDISNTQNLEEENKVQETQIPIKAEIDKDASNNPYTAENLQLDSDNPGYILVDGNYKCTVDPLCLRVFTQVKNFKNHIEKRHLKTKERNFFCLECPKAFYTQFEVKGHFDRVHGNLEKKHQCTYCEKKFFQIGDVKAHVKGVHLKIKDIKCDFCDLAFTQKPNLKTHMRKIHSKTM